MSCITLLLRDFDCDVRVPIDNLAQVIRIGKTL
jgi:hypothetical protein